MKRICTLVLFVVMATELSGSHLTGVDEMIVERELQDESFRPPMGDVAFELKDAAPNNFDLSLGTRSRRFSVRQILKYLKVPNLRKISQSKLYKVIKGLLIKFRIFLRINNIRLLRPPRSYNRFLSKYPQRILNVIASASGCQLTARPRRCKYSDIKYRNIDGRCNNLRRPLFGAANTIQNRIVKEAYGNKINSPRNRNLPSPRVISQLLVMGKEIPSDVVTDMLKTFGQFLDHDFSLTPHASASKCKSCKNHVEPCYPIPVPSNDDRIKKHKCLLFGRSSVPCGTGLSSPFYRRIIPRQQINTITSFIDGSNIYGSSLETLKKLRMNGTLSRRLKTYHNKTGEQFLPFDVTFPPTCNGSKCVPNFLAGDGRVNENIQLIAMHTIWVRYHNLVADKLAKLNKNWNEERVFQETKKIVSAVLQKIVFWDYLPRTLGENALPRYRGYRKTHDPSVFTSFSTAAFRYGHRQIKLVIERLQENLKPIPSGNVFLHEAFFRPDVFISGGGTDPLMRGLFATPGRYMDSSEKIIDNVIRDKLFSQFVNPAADLAALNVQRGRDHGLPGYNVFRRLCRLRHGRVFGLLKDIPRVAQIRLRKVYKRVNDIDLWVGGMLERPVRGGQIGPTFRCLLIKQFQLLRNGDRFYFDQKSQFNYRQRREIKKMTLAKVICLTGRTIKRIPRDVFTLTKAKDFEKCCKLPNLNLAYWKHGNKRRKHNKRKSGRK